MDALSRFVTGRRSKWVVIAVWIVAVITLSGVGSKLADVTTDDTESFLPKDVESTDVVKEFKADYPQGETSTGLIVYRRKGGLMPEDQKTIAADAKAIQGLGQEKIPLTQPPSPPVVSPDGSVATLTLTVPVDFNKSGDWGKNVRDITSDAREGPKVSRPTSPATSGSALMRSRSLGASTRSSSSPP